MSACGGPVHSSETSKNESSSSQSNGNSSSNSDSTNSSTPQGNDNPSSNSDLINRSSSKKMTPTFNQMVLDSFYPGWLLSKYWIIHFPDHDVIIAGIVKQPYAKVIVVQFDSASEKWSTKWSGDISTMGFGVLVTQPNSEKMALALVITEVGINQNRSKALALTIDDNGTCKLEETLDSIDMTSEQQGNVLIVNGSRKLGMRTLSLQEKKYVDSKTPASQLSPAGSVQVTFRLDNDGNVVAAQQNSLNMKVGHTIAFVPADARTKDEFDKGNIEIFTDWGNGNLATSDEDGIWSGNSATLAQNGTVQFLLISDKKMNDPATLNTKPIPTFIAHVQP